MRHPLAALLAAVLGWGLWASPAAADGYSLWNVAEAREQAVTDAAKALPVGAMVLLGEQHDNLSHHMAQLEVIVAIKAAGRPLAVGLEMFEQRNQATLDAWVAGSISEKAMSAAFEDNWDGSLWPQYRPIFAYCREQKIPMLGLNVPRAITRQVARRGFGSLSKEQLGNLPAVACIVDPEYEEALRSLLGPHGMDQGTFTRFCEAQLVWDTAMAHYGLEYMKAKPGTTVAVLAGHVHAWKKAIPAQVRRLSENVPTVSVLPSIPGGLSRETVRLDDADYLMLGVD